MLGATNTTLALIAGAGRYEGLTKSCVQKDRLNVFVMGSTGVGKSSFLSFLARPEGPPEFHSADSLGMVTQSVSSYAYDHESFLWLYNDEVRTYPVRLIDSPGLNDTQDKGIDLQHISNLVDSIRQRKKIDSLVFVVKLNDRCDKQYLETLRYCCRDLFGKVPKNFIKIVFTYLDNDKYEEFQDEEYGEDTYLEKREEIFSYFSPHVGNKTFKCYFVNTAKKNPRRVKDALQKYYNFCRNNSSLTPGLKSIYPFTLENVDVYSLYIRDKIIHDIHKHSIGYNWKRSRVAIPPSINDKRNAALVELYKKKELLTANIAGAQSLEGAINDLIRRKNLITDKISQLKGDHENLGDLNKSVYPYSGNSARFSCRTSSDKVLVIDNSEGIKVVTGAPIRNDDCLTWNITFERSGWLKSGTLRLKFLLEGKYKHMYEISSLTREKKVISEEIKEKTRQNSQHHSLDMAELKSINKRISLLSRTHHKMDRLEDLYSNL